MNITIIGCGTMGSGLAKQLSAHHTLFLYDHRPEKAQRLQQEGYGTACENLHKALQQSDHVILAVKPKNLEEVVSLMRTDLTHYTLISLLAGTPLAKLKQEFPHQHIVRMMPNLAMIYGEGLIGLTSDDFLTEEERKQFSTLFKPLGKVYWLLEAKMNAFTSLAGSGPAFVFAIIESMIDAGIGMGFNAQDAQELVHQMITGSLHLLDKSAKHPGELKWQVASPEGTTIAGLKKLEELALRGSIINIFFAAYERANELSNS